MLLLLLALATQRPDSLGAAVRKVGRVSTARVVLEHVNVATLNGAIFLGRQSQIGSIAVGKNADLVVMKGDPATRIADIENVEIVFKDGVGYDTAKLLESVKGRYGEY